MGSPISHDGRHLAKDPRFGPARQEKGRKASVLHAMPLIIRPDIGCSVLPGTRKIRAGTKVERFRTDRELAGAALKPLEEQRARCDIYEYRGQILKASAAAAPSCGVDLGHRTLATTRVETHKQDSHGGSNVIQALRQQERGFERVLVE